MPVGVEVNFSGSVSWQAPPLRTPADVEIETRYLNRLYSGFGQFA